MAVNMATRSGIPSTIADIAVAFGVHALGCQNFLKYERAFPMSGESTHVTPEKFCDVNANTSISGVLVRWVFLSWQHCLWVWFQLSGLLGV